MDDEGVFWSPIYFFNLYWICYNITSVLCLFLFFWPRGIWDLSSLNEDQTHDACIGRWGLHHWTMREVPVPQFFILGVYPEVELPSHMRILFLILKESSYSFPQWLYHFIFPLRMQKSSSFSTSSPTLVCLLFAMPHGMPDVSSPTRMEPGPPVAAAWNPNHGIPNTCCFVFACLFLDSSQKYQQCEMSPYYCFDLNFSND